MFVKSVLFYSLPYVVGAVSSAAISPLVFYKPASPVVIVNRSLKSDRLPIHQTISPMKRMETPGYLERDREIETCKRPSAEVLGRCFAEDGQSRLRAATQDSNAVS